eukprot:TRINITY_DN32834_c0_g1_i1.p1 TRINITY_DN32834_c0_g1~~TRINITY_DN32834_c0_g1_i1.p1  ORF type:complete len:242 (+),score=40.49 TRINITY_DN32834_c0_g1_i1:80-805(+)
MLSRYAAQQISRVAVAAQCRTKTTVIMGPPGGGKGTISKKLIKDFEFHHISTGDMLRAQVRQGTDLGLQAKKHMDSGGLVPNELIIGMVMSEISGVATSRILLDGFPRTREQAEALNNAKKVELALNLAVPTEDIVKRISSRWIHAASGRTYAYDYNPPKVEGKDDETGEPLVQRDDDKPESVRSRLQLYDDQTLPLLDFYKAEGCLHQFDGSDHPELLAQDKRSDAIYASLKPFMARILS